MESINRNSIKFIESLENCRISDPAAAPHGQMGSTAWESVKQVLQDQRDDAIWCMVYQTLDEPFGKLTNSMCQ